MWTSVDYTDKQYIEMDWLQMKEAWFPDWLQSEIQHYAVCMQPA